MLAGIPLMEQAEDSDAATYSYEPKGLNNLVLIVGDKLTISNDTDESTSSQSNHWWVRQNFSSTIPGLTATRTRITLLNNNYDTYTHTGTLTTPGVYEFSYSHFTFKKSAGQNPVTSNQQYTITITVIAPPVVSFTVSDSTFGSINNTASITLSNTTTHVWASSNKVLIGSTSNYRTATANTSVTGYSNIKFSKWDYSTDGGATWTALPTTKASSIVVQSDVILKAVFTYTINTYTVTIQSNNTGYGTVNKSSVTVDYNTSISSSGATLTIGSNTATATPNANTSSYNYAFSNWSGIPSDGKVTGNITVTANFSATPKYTCHLNFNANGGSGQPGNLSYTGTSTSNHTFTIPSTTPTRATYTFLGWSTSNTATSSQYAANGTISVGYNSTVTLYAVWKINTYTVTYKNGSSTIHTENVAHNSTITHTTHDSINGKLFCGWYTDSNLTSLYDTSTKITAAKTLWGQFVDPLTFTSSPVANATITYASGMGCVLFDALESQSPAKVLWDFGDGTFGDEIVMYHHYEEPGTYDVSLSVYNYNGDVDTRTYAVVVYDTTDGPPREDNTLLIAGIFAAVILAGFVVIRPF